MNDFLQELGKMQKKNISALFSLAQSKHNGEIEQKSVL